MRIERQKHHHTLVTTFMLYVCLSFFVTITSRAANTCHTELLAHYHTELKMCHLKVMLCLFNSKCESLHQNPSLLYHSHRPCHTFDLEICCGGPFVLLSHLFICLYIIWIHPSIHSFPSFPLCLFLFPPQRFIHPSEHPVLSIPFIGMIVILAVVWCWLSELASQRARYGRSLSLSDALC